MIGRRVIVSRRRRWPAAIPQRPGGPLLAMLRTLVKGHKEGDLGVGVAEQLLDLRCLSKQASEERVVACTKETGCEVSLAALRCTELH